MSQIVFAQSTIYDIINRCERHKELTVQCRLSDAVAYIYGVDYYNPHRLQGGPKNKPLLN